MGGFEEYSSDVIGVDPPDVMDEEGIANGLRGIELRETVIW